MVELIRSYCNRDDLRVDLEHTVDDLAKALKAPGRRPRSVRTTGRTGRNVPLEDRLTEDDIRAIIERCRSGESHRAVGRDFGLYHSSVRRVLSRYEVASFLVAKIVV